MKQHNTFNTMHTWLAAFNMVKHENLTKWPPYSKDCKCLFKTFFWHFEWLSEEKITCILCQEIHDLNAIKINHYSTTEIKNNFFFNLGQAETSCYRGYICTGIAWLLNALAAVWEGWIMGDVIYYSSVNTFSTNGGQIQHIS